VFDFLMRLMFRTLSNANPAINTSTIPGSGTTRISASFGCADSRRHGPFTQVRSR
jgi:hypothetical protein